LFARNGVPEKHDRDQIRYIADRVFHQNPLKRIITMGEIDFTLLGPRVQEERANRTGSRFFVRPEISLRDVDLILGR